MSFVDKWRPAFAPDTEAGTPEPTGSPPPSGGDERSEPGPGSGRSTLRQQLEKNFETDRKANETPERPDPNTGRSKGTPKSRAREHMEAEGQAEPQEAITEEVTEEAAQPATVAPTGWTAEAKAAWAETPAPVQAAVIKREQDMAKGVEELKNKYADIDKILAPRLDSMRRFGHKPHEAVGQLFAWFDALSANPDVAFPALAASFRYDLRRLLGAQQQPQQPAQQPAAQPTVPEGEEISPAVQQYISKITQEMETLKGAVQQQFGQLQNTFAQQSQAKTDDMLAQWAKGKPHYDKVRTLMGKLIIGMQQDNSVPLLQNGSVDLDAVYDMALYASPEVRAEIFAAQKVTEEAERKKKADAERKAQTDQAEKARRAASGIAPSAPGQQAPTKGQRKGGKSVRDSLKEAMEELAQ